MKSKPVFLTSRITSGSWVCEKCHFLSELQKVLILVVENGNQMVLAEPEHERCDCGVWHPIPVYFDTEDDASRFIMKLIHGAKGKFATLTLIPIKPIYTHGTSQTIHTTA